MNVVCAKFCECIRNFISNQLIIWTTCTILAKYIKHTSTFFVSIFEGPHGYLLNVVSVIVSHGLHITEDEHEGKKWDVTYWNVSCMMINSTSRIMHSVSWVTSSSHLLLVCILFNIHLLHWQENLLFDMLSCNPHPPFVDVTHSHDIVANLLFD